jgi:hypothetical protein
MQIYSGFSGFAYVFLSGCIVSSVLILSSRTPLTSLCRLLRALLKVPVSKLCLLASVCVCACVSVST